MKPWESTYAKRLDRRFHTGIPFIPARYFWTSQPEYLKAAPGRSLLVFIEPRPALAQVIDSVLIWRLWRHYAVKPAHLAAIREVARRARARIVSYGDWPRGLLVNFATSDDAALFRLFWDGDTEIPGDPHA